LENFCAEFNILLTDGIIFKNSFGILLKKKVVLDGFCCDVPAKSFILYCKGHSGYFSCFRCIAEGEYIKNNGVRFPELDSQKRTRIHFVNKFQEEHHTSETLSNLCYLPGIDIVQCFSVNYMHLVCLEVVRSLIKLWLSRGPLTVGLPNFKTKIIIIKIMYTTRFSTKTTCYN